MKHSIKDWIIAVRPWSFPASAMPVLVTVMWLWSRSMEVNWWLGLAAILAIVLVHASGNVWSDIADYRYGVDAPDTFGARSLVEGHFTTRDFYILSMALLAVAILFGLLLVWLTGLPLLYIGVAGVALSICYPWLKYAALGDVVIIFCYALLPMLGTSYIVTGSVVWDVLWLSVPVGLITVAILHANNVRDIETDRRAGVQTFPLLTGRKVGMRMYAFEVLFPYLWMLILICSGIVSAWLALCAISLPLALGNARQALQEEQDWRLACAHLDENTAKLQLMFSCLLVVGMLLSVLL